MLTLKNTQLFIRQFWQNYVIAGTGIFVTLSLVYVAAMHTNSGIIAIMFALTPLATGIFSKIILKNNELNKYKLISIIIGFIDIFLDYVNLKLDIFYLVLLLVAMSFQAFISIKLKQLSSSANAIQTTTGGLLFSFPFFVFSFLLIEDNLPIISNTAIISTIYLAIFGSVIGLSYYYLIKNISILTVGIIPLITPVFALILGFYVNNEVMNSTQIIGIFIVLIALIYFQFYNQINAKITRLC